MQHWRHCQLHSVAINCSRQIGVRKFKADKPNVESALDNLYTNLSTTQHFKSGDSYPIKIVPFEQDASTLALTIFLDHYHIDYELLCNEEPRGSIEVDTSNSNSSS